MEAVPTPNSAKEIIAIEPKEESKSQLKAEKRTFGPPVMDRTILPRVKNYLKEHKAVYVDIDEMVDELRSTYHEYGRRKRIPFKHAVEQAFERLVQMHKGSEESLGHSTSEEDEEEDDDEDDDDDDPDDPDDPEELNSTNEQLMVMYSGQNIRKRPQHKEMDDDDGGGGAEKELINISSDESGKEESSVPNVANGTLSRNAPPVPESQTSKPAAVIRSAPPQSQQPLTTVRTYAKRKRPVNTPETPVTQQAKRRKEVSTVVPKITFEDFGGNTKVLEEICQLLIHIRHPEVYKQIGVSPPRGFLLHGPPGCGKTLLAQAISGELQVPMISVAAPELVAGVSGESEERIRDLFNQAVATAPCILFLDEIDAITPNRHTAQREMERRIVAQLLSCLDELGQKENGDRIVVIGATNRPDALDPALRRAGRFDREVCLGIPDEKARIDILKVLCKKLKLPEDFDFHYIAKNTPGFVGADLTALTREAAVTAVNRVFTELQNKVEEKMEVDDSEIIVEEAPNVKPSEEKPSQSDIQTNKKTLETAKEKTLSLLMTWLLAESPIPDEELRKLTVTLNDFKTALKGVQPSAKREGFATIPDVTWEDIGSLKDIREELQMTILAPVRYPEQFQELGISTPSGVLLCGPPGCGKTLLAKAVANEAGINFISVKGPELLNMYVGESEKAVRQCFQRARNSAPCVIFFDEIDALCPKRSDSGEGGASMRVVNQMLTEMDGIEGRKGVFLMAASNRPDIIDPAVLRPGRLDKLLYIGLPSAADRTDILKAITKDGKRPCLGSDVDLEAIAKNNCCERYTGADLAALVREAGIEALKEYMNLGTTESKKLVITNDHFLNAFKKIRPSVSERDQKHYEKLQTMYSSVSREENS